MNEDCPHCVFERTEANCRGCFEGSHYKPKPITNADRIRSLSDEELAEWIADDLIEPGYNTREQTVKMWLNWLKEEVEGDNNENQT